MTWPLHLHAPIALPECVALWPGSGLMLELVAILSFLSDAGISVSPRCTTTRQGKTCLRQQHSWIQHIGVACTTLCHELHKPPLHVLGLPVRCEPGQPRTEMLTRGAVPRKKNSMSLVPLQSSNPARAVMHCHFGFALIRPIATWCARYSICTPYMYVCACAQIIRTRILRLGWRR